MSSAICFNLDKSKILSSDNGLRVLHKSIIPISTNTFLVVSYPFTQQILILMHQQQKAFENIVGKEIACDEQFLLFPQCFLLDLKIVSPIVNIFDIISLFDA